MINQVVQGELLRGGIRSDKCIRNYTHVDTKLHIYRVRFILDQQFYIHTLVVAFFFLDFLHSVSFQMSLTGAVASLIKTREFNCSKSSRAAIYTRGVT